MSSVSTGTPAVGEPGGRDDTRVVADPPSVLIVAWEYPGFNSRQGTALSRRVGQLARAFARANWRVSVVHPVQRADDPAAKAEVTERLGDGAVIHRRAIGQVHEGVSRERFWQLPLRKATTMWHALRYGDRSGVWASAVIDSASRGALRPHACIIACFTPRGPLRAAHALHRLWGVPWIADMQDPWWEGTSLPLRPLVARWMRRTLRAAASVIQVSPEWARQDAAVIGRDVTVFRHAVPSLDGSIGTRAPRRGTGFSILYVGSLNEDYQDVGPFIDALKLLRDRQDGPPVTLQVAGSDAVWGKFAAAATARGVGDALEHLGWLTDSELRTAATAADALLLIPCFPTWRQCVPSKLYEYVAFATPTLIAGTDSGSVRQLLSEWGHVPVVAEHAADIADAVQRAHRGDTSGLLDRARCTRTPLSEAEFGARYVAHAQGIVGNPPCTRETTHSGSVGDSQR